MTPRTEERLLPSLTRFQKRDPALYEELRSKLQSGLDDRVAETARALSLAVELPSVEGGAGESRVVETIVRAHARPVLTIRDNRATTEFLGPESRVWGERVEAARSVLDRIIPAVGRVEMNNNPDYAWGGTGWLVADDIVVTNRHVARLFGRLGSTGAFTFRIGVNGGPMTSRIDFLEEDQRLASLEYTVSSILWIAPASQPDVAFLRLTRAAGDRPLASPVVLADSVAEDAFVATIGYPARDSRVPDQDLVRQIFGDVYEKKRLAPGQVLEVRDDELEHDCSTLGGNSGSLVMDLGTGHAVGLHFSGLFMEANFAVPAPKLRDLLRRVQQGELPGAVTLAGPPQPAVVPPAVPTFSPGTYTLSFQIPVEITVKVGAPVPAGGPAAGLVGGPAGATAATTGDPYENALRTAREMLADDPDVIEVRLGYRFKRGWITDERVVVCEMREKLSAGELQRSGKRLIPPQILGVGVDVRTAALPDQLEHLGIDLEAVAVEERARPGAYREPPDLALERVKEPMKAVFHASPDSGFPNLKAFLGRVRNSLTATMYEWEAEHISDAIEAAVRPAGRTLRMVTQKQGTRTAVADMKSRLGSKFQHVWASVGPGKLIPSAYHIKVASRDGEEVWLSSGNWKNSNQADINPAADGTASLTPLLTHNREWHAILKNKKLAQMFQRYIEFDFQEAQRVPLDEALEVVLPDVFVPELVFQVDHEAVAAARYFKPLVVDRELDVQPLLTPDRDSQRKRIFMAHAIAMIQRGTRKIYVENQSFNLLDDNNEELETFFEILRDKQRAGVDVRVIFRDAREFGSGSATSQQKLIERIKDFGFDTDFVRLQKGCHTKGILVDSAEVMIGSHNLTNEGSLFNRDASLLVRDPEVAQYFETLFLFDWKTLARQEADELVGGVRLAQPGEETPVGFRRVSLEELRGES